eukprot:gene19463-10124_t
MGWRLGAAIGPKDIIRKISVISSNHDTCTTHFLRRRRDCLTEELQKCPGERGKAGF